MPSLSNWPYPIFKGFQIDRSGMQQHDCLLQILIGPGPKHSQTVPDYTCVRVKTQIVAERVPAGVKDGRSFLIKTTMDNWISARYCCYVLCRCTIVSLYTFASLDIFSTKMMAAPGPTAPLESVLPVQKFLHYWSLSIVRAAHEHRQGVD